VWEIWRLFYNLFAVPAVQAAVRLAAVRRDVRSGLAARRGWRARLRKALQPFDREKTLLWFHCASLGEFEQTRPVLSELRTRHGERVTILQSFFSETGLRHGLHRGLADYAFLLPIDGRAGAGFLLKTIRPDLLCFVKSDVWPELAWSAGEAGVPLALVSASAHRRSGIANPLLRGFYRAVFRPFGFIGTASRADADLFEPVVGSRVEVTGDSKYDAVISRRDSAGGPPIRFGDSARILVCGSTHPPDERLLLPILAELLDEFSDLSIVLAPHHVDGGRLEGIESDLAARGVSVERLTALTERGDGAGGGLVLVDTVGCLFELYARAQVAYVGGGFWDRGLHNVLEPAAFGAALVFGPRIENSVEARCLAEAGTAERVEDADGLRTALRGLLANPAEAERRGAAARRFCERRAGAAARIVDGLEKRFTARRQTGGPEYGSEA
jgi:3-deoxy-D-manno-octulosonic-acid transferase